MAQRTVQLLFCDLHDEEVEGQETVPFSVDGTTYEVDVCAKHAEELRDSLRPFVSHGRKQTAARRKASSRSRGSSNRERSADIRAWAKAHGIQVNERGRIPASVVRQYEAAR